MPKRLSLFCFISFISLFCCVLRVQSICRPLRNYFYNVLHTKYRAATDVYALMFLADVVDFVIIIFGFWAFGVSFYHFTF